MQYGKICALHYMFIFSVLNEPKNTIKKRHGLQDIGRIVQSVEETPEPIPTTIKGTIPTWICGNFLRNGPGKFEFGNQQ